MKLDKTMLAPSKFESAEGPKSQRAQLENKCYVFSDEVKSIDSDTIKDWTGGSKINARGMRKDNASFAALFNMIEIMFNDNANGEIDLKLKFDTGMNRRVVAVKHEHGYEDCSNAEEAEVLQARWKEEGRTGIFPMYPAKQKAIMALAPTFMTRLIRIHQKSTAPGGSWLEMPLQVDEWTTQLWAETAEENLLERPISLWYKRCTCKPKDPTDETNLNLVDVNGERCTHFITGKNLNDKLKSKIMGNGQSLYKRVKGQGRNHEAIYATLRKAKAKALGDIRLEKKGKTGEEKIFGLIDQSAADETPAPSDGAAAASPPSPARVD
tara:strand:- start:61 stop:1032 length:972 start_codon:yes stop_codon:yes gene_type:complete